MESLLVTNDYASLGEAEGLRVVYDKTTDLVWIDTPIQSLYEFVDLGLPSGLKWASCNVGASKPEEFGLYFAWGETQGYADASSGKGFCWGDYKFTTAATGATDADFRGGLTKYNTDSASGIVDNKLVLEQVDDAAYVSDNTCRMPTKADFEELTAKTISEWETLNGVNGRRFTSTTTGNSIFVPAAGWCGAGSVRDVGSYGYYWSSSLDESIPRCCWDLFFYSGNLYMYGNNRRSGYPVRAVCA